MRQLTERQSHIQHKKRHLEGGINVLQKPMPKQVKVGGIIPAYEDARNQVADSAAERQIIAAPPLSVFTFRSLTTRGKPALNWKWKQS